MTPSGDLTHTARTSWRDSMSLTAFRSRKWVHRRLYIEILAPKDFSFETIGSNKIAQTRTEANIHHFVLFLIAKLIDYWTVRLFQDHVPSKTPEMDKYHRSPRRSQSSRKVIELRHDQTLLLTSCSLGLLREKVVVEQQTFYAEDSDVIKTFWRLYKKQRKLPWRRSIQISTTRLKKRKRCWTSISHVIKRNCSLELTADK